MLQASNLKFIARHEASVGGFHIFGTKFQHDGGELLWAISTSQFPARDYLLSKGRFLLLGLHRFYNETDQTLLEPVAEATDIEPAEKQAILNAIAEWESKRNAE